MIDRRTFLKLSAGALVLTAAGALTGCGTTMDLNHPQQEVDGVMFLCDVLSETDFSGGAPTKIQYRPYFAIWNRSEEDVSIPRKDITGIFTKNGAAAGEDGVSPRHVESWCKAVSGVQPEYLWSGNRKQHPVVPSKRHLRAAH